MLLIWGQPFLSERYWPAQYDQGHALMQVWFSEELFFAGCKFASDMKLFLKHA